MATVPVSAENGPVATDLFAAASAALDHATRAQASSLTAAADNLSREMDSGISNWKAQGGTTTATEESKLDLARTDFTQKIRTLTLADDDTWRNAKEAAQSSLENLRQAYDGLMAGQKHN